MMLNRAAPVAALLLAAAGVHFSEAADPSEGWLSYTVFKAQPTQIITRLSAKMVVPDSPKMPGSSPAFWFGVQTAKGDGALVQPIMAKELGYRPGSGSSFYMFQEIFDWTAENDTQTKPYKVPAGDEISASVSYVAADNSYNMNMTSKATGAISNFNYRLMSRQKATESVAYFVLEHQPEKCNQLPPNGVVQWTDIEVEVDHEIVTEPVWHAVEESPKCKSKAVVVNSTAVKITWDATAPDPQYQ